MRKNSGNVFIWESEVRSYELDVQGIVNNAYYLHYFDHARVKHLLSKGIDWEKWHNDGFDLVLHHVDMEIKASLKSNELFYVTSKVEKSGKLRIIFEQAIYRKKDDRLIAKAQNIVACLLIETGKPVMPDELLSALFC